MNLNNFSKGDHFFKTRWGTLKIKFTPAGLDQILFADDSHQQLNDDVYFRNNFVNWFNDFQNATTDERWNAFSPRGTDFQRQVWRALLEIPFGSKVHYGEIAAQIGRPKAYRAVGSAVGANPIALLIPCHRVVPANGGVGNYRWKPDRKQALLEAEEASNSSILQLF